MPRSGTKLDISFRFLALTSAQVTALQELDEQGESLPASKKHPRPGFMTPVREELFDWLPTFLVDNAVSEADYDVFVSVVSEWDTWIVDLPPCAIELIRRVGGGVTFSATMV